ncbi:YsnF/AvaK domain-containing protein [Erwinia tasmaniensis]|uniref:YsnF/AvaK domain-containing protein n=1 Tax=Erwinia tasmaniensis TaxID=338565 RepID=UPI003A4DB2D9
MSHEKIVTAFNQLQQAEAAKEKLIVEGIAEKNIDIISGKRLQVEDKEIRHPSFWQRLFGTDVDDNYATEYSKALRSGGVLLTVKVPKDQADHIEHELSAFAADYSSLSTHRGALTGGEFAGETNDLGTTPGSLSSTATAQTPIATPAGKGPETDRDALKLAEEEVAIGKRQVSDGSVRLRRYTVEDEVSEDVSLYDQHAEVFRRAVDEPAYLNDVDWSDKTIEVEESHEIPTIEKTTRVKEEVGLRGEETARTETVKDSVRRQEVEVEHDKETRLNTPPVDKKF